MEHFDKREFCKYYREGFCVAPFSERTNTDDGICLGMNYCPAYKEDTLVSSTIERLQDGKKFKRS